MHSLINQQLAAARVRQRLDEAARAGQGRRVRRTRRFNHPQVPRRPNL